MRERKATARGQHRDMSKSLPKRRTLLAAAAACVLAGCVSVTQLPRALVLEASGKVAVESLACGPVADGIADGPALDPAAIRILTWNVHKQSDAGWARDLTAFAAGNDLLLLQEVVLDAPLRDVVEGEGMHWVMASSFMRDEHDIGVLTSTRTAPLASCTERVVEPLIRLPKSAVITWFRLAGRDDTLAVANVHAINFTLDLASYRAQLMALADALAAHRGPLVLAGDLNTWTASRARVMRDVAARLGLTEVKPCEDRRSLFFGRQLDHIYVRGLVPVAAEALPVRSSDHNPLRATLRVALTPEAPSCADAPRAPAAPAPGTRAAAPSCSPCPG
jgi:endonuclease/exonuclease/phosphatase (EEP) superfamily protein YafD